MTVDARAITVRHGLLWRREQLHFFDLRREPEMGHDPPGDLIVRLGVVDLILGSGASPA